MKELIVKRSVLAGDPGFGAPAVYRLTRIPCPDCGGHLNLFRNNKMLLGAHRMHSVGRIREQIERWTEMFGLPPEVVQKFFATARLPS